MTLQELMELNGPWSNEACKGYVIAALEAMNAAPEEIQAVISSLSNQFEDMSVEEARNHYTSSRY